MDYIFGNPKEKEILETCGNEYTNLSGWFEITQNDEDVPITDRCYIKYKLGSRKDDSDKYHVWYEITNHSRYIDLRDVLCEIDAGGNIMDRIWAKRLKAGKNTWSECPENRKTDVDAILRQNVADSKITAAQYAEITGTPYN